MDPSKKKKKLIMQTSNTHASWISNQSGEKKIVYPSACLSFTNKVFVDTIRSKRYAYFLLRINYMTQMVAITNLLLTSDFKVTMINYKHILSIFHCQIFCMLYYQSWGADPNTAAAAWEVQRSVSQQLCRKSHPSTHRGVTSSILTFPVLISDSCHVSVSK